MMNAVVDTLALPSSQLCPLAESGESCRGGAAPGSSPTISYTRQLDDSGRAVFKTCNTGMNHEFALSATQILMEMQALKARLEARNKGGVSLESLNLRVLKCAFRDVSHRNALEIGCDGPTDFCVDPHPVDLDSVAPVGVKAFPLCSGMGVGYNCGE